MFSTEVWDDLSGECKTTSYLGFESMSGFHSGHDPLAQEDEKREKNLSKEKIQARSYIQSVGLLCECSGSDGVLFQWNRTRWLCMMSEP